MNFPPIYFMAATWSWIVWLLSISPSGWSRSGPGSRARTGSRWSSAHIALSARNWWRVAFDAIHATRRATVAGELFAVSRNHVQSSIAKRHRPVQIVRCECDLHEEVQLGQLRRHRPREGIFPQRQFGECGDVAQRCWDGTAHVRVLYLQICKQRELTELGWQRAGEGAACDSDACHACQLAHFCGQRALNVSELLQGQHPQVRQVSNFGWERSTEWVGMKDHRGEKRQQSYLGR
mmetsp:Transcript_22656/g.64139  ORF Transcript_22656/g.64139 Transcript_22656/m.64139 type:complete len:235 (-) Transcript_22656:1303-2007(-)